MGSIKLKEFIQKQGKAIERALNEDDLTLMEELIDQDDLNMNDDLKGDSLRHMIKFKDDNYTANRIVTSLNWSSNIDNLLLASYGINP